ncbi:hypothetical protein BH23PLA1_BH23PLA1_37800 [soil metagenome]
MRFLVRLLLAILAVTPSLARAGVEIQLAHESIPVGHGNALLIKQGTQSGEVATVEWAWRTAEPAPASDWFPVATNEVFGGIPGKIEVRLRVTYQSIMGMPAPPDEEAMASFTVKAPTHDDLVEPVDFVELQGEQHGRFVNFKIFVGDEEMGGHHSHSPSVYVQERVQVMDNPASDWVPPPPEQGVVPAFYLSSHLIKDYKYYATSPGWDTAQVGELVLWMYQTHRIVFVDHNQNKHPYELNTTYITKIYKHRQNPMVPDEYRMTVEKYEEDP